MQLRVCTRRRGGIGRAKDTTVPCTPACVPSPPLFWVDRFLPRPLAPPARCPPSPFLPLITLHGPDSNIIPQSASRPCLAYSAGSACALAPGAPWCAFSPRLPLLLSPPSRSPWPLHALDLPSLNISAWSFLQHPPPPACQLWQGHLACASSVHPRSLRPCHPSLEPRQLPALGRRATQTLPLCPPLARLAAAVPVMHS
jgi:hypothetical protein